MYLDSRALLDKLLIHIPYMQSSIPPNAQVKIWKLDQQDKDGYYCVKSFKVFDKMPEQPIISMAVTEDLSCIAVGLKDGKIIIIRVL